MSKKKRKKKLMALSLHELNKPIQIKINSLNRLILLIQLKINILFNNCRDMLV